MAKKKRRKATRRGDALRLRMTRALARHGLTITQAGQLADADLRQRKGIGRIMIAVIRAAAGPAPPPPATERDGRAHRIATLERQVTELLEAVTQLQDLLRVRGIDRREPSSPDARPEEGRPRTSQVSPTDQR